MKRRPARSVAPVDHCLSEGASRRLRHTDVGQLSDLEIWAEQLLVERELAELTFNRVRPQFLDSEQTVQDWLAARSCRLRGELANRRAKRGTHVA